MKINDSSYKVLINMIEEHLKLSEKNNKTDLKKTEDTSQLNKNKLAFDHNYNNENLLMVGNNPQNEEVDNFLTINKITLTDKTNLPAEIKGIIEKLSKEELKTLIKTLTKHQLPFNTSNLKSLIKILKQNTSQKTINQEIKSFVFLAKNKLPALPFLIKGLAAQLTPETNGISQQLNQEISVPPTHIKNELTQYLNQNAKEFTDRLINHSDILKDIINLLSNNENKEAYKLLSKLSNEELNSLIKTFTKYQLPVNLKNLGSLVKILQQNVSTDVRDQEIKSFIFSVKDKLPNSPSLIKGNTVQLKPETGDIIQPNLENTNLSTQIKNKLTIHINQNTKELTNKLIEYPDNIKNAINLLSSTTGKDNNELLSKLIGQQLLNTRENILLALELPIFFPQYNKTIPGFLQVSKEENSKRKNKDAEMGFKVSYIIFLEKRGTIRADIKFLSGQLTGMIYSDSDDTIALIKKQLPLLKEKLKDIGFKSDELIIGKLSKENTESTPWQLYVEEDYTETKAQDNLIHFDLKV